MMRLRRRKVTKKTTRNKILYDYDQGHGDVALIYFKKHIDRRENRMYYVYYKEQYNRYKAKEKMNCR